MLALTSNPDGPRIQHARDFHDTPVALHVARHAEDVGAGTENRWGSVGLVVGATVGDAFTRLGLAEATTSAPILAPGFGAQGDRKSTRLNSSHVAISYAVFCLKKKKHD